MNVKDNKINDKELDKVNGGTKFFDYYSNDDMPKFVGKVIRLKIAFGDDGCWVILDAYNKNKKEAIVRPYNQEASKYLENCAGLDNGWFDFMKRIWRNGDGRYTIDYGRLVSTFFYDAQV